MEETDYKSIAEWFREWGKLVDSVDFIPARNLFVENVVGFGTHMNIVKGLNYLEEQQWRQVWPTIKGFHFDTNTLECLFSPDRLQCVGILVWRSNGFAADKVRFERNGRATVVLCREAIGGGWKGTHTHLSLNRGTPQQSYGDRPPKS